MSNPQIKTQARIEAYEGIELKTIKQKGSDGQKLMAPLFDTDGNGKLEGYEVEAFNNCRFKAEPGKVTVFDKYYETPNITEIKYGKDGFQGEYQSYQFALRNKKHYFSILGNPDATGGMITKVDLTKGKVTVENADPNYPRGYEMWANNVDLTVKNSQVSSIDIYGGSLKLENV